MLFEDQLFVWKTFLEAGLSCAKVVLFCRSVSTCVKPRIEAG